MKTSVFVVEWLTDKGVCVLTQNRMCPYPATFVSSRENACVLTQYHVCPHAFTRVSLCIYASVHTGVNDVDGTQKYARFQHALETALRRVAKSGSRLFKVKDLMSKSAWINADVWRKHRCLIFLLRYFRKLRFFSRNSA